ncbi:hypothetical protein FF1_044100 [Malus domestica]
MTTLSWLATRSSSMAFPVGFLCCFILCLPFPAIVFFFLSSTSTRVGHRGKKSGGKPTKAVEKPICFSIR